MGKVTKWLQRIRMISKQLNEDNVRAFAAQSAYFLMLSAIPLLILVTAIFQIFLKNTNIRIQIADCPIQLLPAGISDFFEKIMNEVYQNTATVLSVSLLTAVWAAGKGMTAITQGLNSIYDVEESRNYIIQRLYGML